MNWQKFKLGFWSVFWGSICGAILITVIGFKWGGWVTGGTAEIMAARPGVGRTFCNAWQGKEFTSIFGVFSHLAPTDIRRALGLAQGTR